MGKKIQEWLKKQINEHPQRIYVALGLIAIALIAMIIIISNAITTKRQKEKQIVSYIEFTKMIDEGSVDTVYYNSQENEMHFTVYNDETKQMKANGEDTSTYRYKNEDTYCYRHAEGLYRRGAWNQGSRRYCPGGKEKDQVRQLQPLGLYFYSAVLHRFPDLPAVSHLLHVPYVSDGRDGLGQDPEQLHHRLQKLPDAVYSK